MIFNEVKSSLEKRSFIEGLCHENKDGILKKVGHLPSFGRLKRKMFSFRLKPLSNYLLHVLCWPEMAT